MLITNYKYLIYIWKTIVFKEFKIDLFQPVVDISYDAY